MSFLVSRWVLQNQHHHVALPDSEALEIRCRGIRLLLQLGIGVLVLQSLVVSPENGVLLWVFGSPGIYHIISEIEVIRNLNLEILDKILLRDVFALFYKPF